MSASAEPSETPGDDQSAHRARRVAIVSFYAPPQPAVASHRVLRLSRVLLAHGHDVHWISLDERLLQVRDDTLAALIPPAVVRHGLGGPTLNSRPAARNLPEKILRSLYHELPKWLALPDRHVEWALRLKRHLPRLVRENGIDVVVLSCGPHGQLLAIPRLRKLVPGVKIVVDYRDLLTGNVWTAAGNPRLQRRLRDRERGWLRHADALFVNTEEARASFLAHMRGTEAAGAGLPFDVEVMRNGADFALMEQVESQGPAIERRPGIHLGYFGTIYPRRRLLPFVRALSALADDVLRTVRLDAFSGAADSQALLTEDLAPTRDLVKAAVRQHGHVPFGEALRAMRGTTALVLVNGEEDADNIFVPAKLYDYLMARRPILFVGKVGDAWRIVEAACGPGHCFTHDQTAELAAAIARLVGGATDVEPATAYGTERSFQPLVSWLAALSD